VSLLNSISHIFHWQPLVITHDLLLTKQTRVEVPAQTRETTWPLGKVAFSLLPLAGSYSRRATGELLTDVASVEIALARDDRIDSERNNH
jgi:hypothetical protein